MWQDKILKFDLTFLPQFFFLLRVLFSPISSCRFFHIFSFLLFYSSIPLKKITYHILHVGSGTCRETSNYDLPHSPITTPVLFYCMFPQPTHPHPSRQLDRHLLACGSFVGLRIETVRFWSGIYLSFFYFARSVGWFRYMVYVFVLGWDSGQKKKKKENRVLRDWGFEKKESQVYVGSWVHLFILSCYFQNKKGVARVAS